MEPQLEGCGKPRSQPVRPTSCLLQWSRNLRVAERRHAVQGGVRNRLLQWSRNLRVVERASLAQAPPPLRLLQWSRNLRVAESNTGIEMVERLEQLQWSRNLRVAESAWDTGALTAAKHSFNGAAT